jgi:hypothetical protein
MYAPPVSEYSYSVLLSYLSATLLLLFKYSFESSTIPAFLEISLQIFLYSFLYSTTLSTILLTISHKPLHILILTILFINHTHFLLSPNPLSHSIILSIIYSFSHLYHYTLIESLLLYYHNNIITTIYSSLNNHSIIHSNYHSFLHYLSSHSYISLNFFSHTIIAFRILLIPIKLTKLNHIFIHILASLTILFYHTFLKISINKFGTNKIFSISVDYFLSCKSFRPPLMMIFNIF